jgi:hypothetical protein
VAVLGLVIACAGESTPPPPVYNACDPLAVSGDDAATIAGAEALWNAIGVTAMGEAGGVAIPLVFESGVSPEEYGLYAGSAIFMNDDLAAAPRSIVLAHELGHAIGLVHVTDRASVMNPGNLTIAPNAEDFASVVALWGTCPVP